MKNYVTGTVLYCCEHCGETFREMGFLGRHKRDVHKTELAVRKENVDKAHPVVPEKHGEIDANLFENFLGQMFEDTFGLPRGLITTAFTRRVNYLLKRHYPNLRRSAARAVLEGRCKGGCPWISIPIHSQVRIERILKLLDLIETMVCEERWKGQTDGQKTIGPQGQEDSEGRFGAGQKADTPPEAVHGRRRGRPRKKEQVAGPIVKRPRGRPRKIKPAALPD